ncbi:hypothetical protein [Argonema galeatum]|nr:hypothetical protein [Argonema galeatum]MCL1468618.1 hypothetical protein [Argonema galeatum A003/A1]
MYVNSAAFYHTIADSEYVLGSIASTNSIGSPDQTFRVVRLDSKVQGQP